jgi:hypothetical protein
MGSHREDADGAECERDPLPPTAVKRRNWPLICGDAVLGHCPRRSGVAGPCESKRAHSEPSCQWAPTVTNDCSRAPWHRAPQRPLGARFELYYDPVVVLQLELTSSLGDSSATPPRSTLTRGERPGSHRPAPIGSAPGECTAGGPTSRPFAEIGRALTALHTAHYDALEAEAEAEGVGWLRAPCTPVATAGPATLLAVR